MSTRIYPAKPDPMSLQKIRSRTLAIIVVIVFFLAQIEPAFAIRPVPLRETKKSAQFAGDGSDGAVVDEIVDRFLEAGPVVVTRGDVNAMKAADIQAAGGLAGAGAAKAGVGDVIKDILSDPENSRIIAEELRQERVDTLSARLSDALVKRELRHLTNADYGAALVWLIENFPTKVEDPGSPSKKLVNENAYRLVIRALMIFSIVNDLPDDIENEQKAALARAILPALVYLAYQEEGVNYKDLLNKCANSFIDSTSLEIATAISSTLAKIGPSLIRIGEIVLDTGEQLDTLLLGQEAIALARRQGWYLNERSFAYYQIDQNAWMAQGVFEQFASALKTAISSTIASAASAAGVVAEASGVEISDAAAEAPSAGRRSVEEAV